MRPRHRVSRNGIELIKRFEGYRRKAAQLPDGRWTIGYGHTQTAREGAEVSEADAEALLIYDLIGVSHVINENVFAPLNQNQFDALCSFAFNLGTDAFLGSQVLRRLNEGQTVQAACAMELWRKTEFRGSRIVVDALVRRRAAEKVLFLTPEGEAWVPAPSPVLRPLVDAEARELIPSERPAEVITSMEGDTVTVEREGVPEPPLPPVEDEQPGEAVRAAAEAVAARLAAIYPESEPEPAPEAEPEEPAADEPLAEDEPATEARPQADFAPPITTPAAPEPNPEEPAGEIAPEPELEPEAFEVPPPPANDTGKVSVLDAPMMVIDDAGAVDFIPARVQPLPPKPEASVIWDLLLTFLGLAFFSFGIYWFYNARPDPAGGFVSPWIVGLLAGLAGVGFLVVSVFRLLQRLSRAAEQD